MPIKHSSREKKFYGLLCIGEYMSEHDYQKRYEHKLILKWDPDLLIDENEDDYERFEKIFGFEPHHVVGFEFKIVEINKIFSVSKDLAGDLSLLIGHLNDDLM